MQRNHKRYSHENSHFACELPISFSLVGFTYKYAHTCTECTCEWAGFHLYFFPFIICAVCIHDRRMFLHEFSTHNIIANIKFLQLRKVQAIDYLNRGIWNMNLLLIQYGKYMKEWWVSSKCEPFFSLQYQSCMEFNTTNDTYKIYLWIWNDILLLCRFTHKGHFNFKFAPKMISPWFWEWAIKTSRKNYFAKIEVHIIVMPMG